MRIGVGYLLQETNSFSPLSTKLEGFRLLLGERAMERWKGTKTEIGAFFDALSEAREEAVPLFAGWAITAGPIEEKEFQHMRSLVVERIREARRLDGLLLAFHGAMCAEETDDCEGSLLQAIREIVGARLPIVLTLDLHANVTRQIIAHANAIVGYKTYPHVDMYETGRNAADLLLHMSRDKVRTVTVLQKIPMIVPAENMQTTGGPMAEVFKAGEAFRLDHSEILSVSAFGVQPWLDVEEMGCATVAVADLKQPVAVACARQMARTFWKLRREFDVQLLDPKEAIEAALATEGQPVVLSESSDSTGSGSPGDSAELLRALLDYAPHVPAALWVRDPETVAQIWGMKPRTRLRTAIGGTLDRIHRRPVPVDAVLHSLSEGRFTLKGKYNTGMLVEMGRTAVIEAGPISIVISQNSAITIDPELYRSQGIEPREKKIVVVKSPNGFRSEYSPFAAKILIVDTPGISSANLRALPYRRIPRPIYPLDPVEFLIPEEAL